MEQWDSAILVVDDEPKLSLMVKELLKRDGYRKVDTAASCAEARERLRQGVYQLMLLDVMLPDGDGFSLFEQMKNIYQTPVMFLSARDEDRARLRGLGLGADDYITKPFLPEELLLRVGAVLRRVYRFEDRESVVQIGEASVDWGAGTITKNGEDQMLTAKEYALLRKLCDNRGKIVSIDVLCDTLWPEGNYGYENSLMVHIRRLREKLEREPSRPEYLVTVRGLGYRLI